MNMMNWWRWNHEIVRWQTDDDFKSSAPHDLNDVSFDTSRTRHVQWTYSRFIWWRFSRGMTWEVHDLAPFTSYLGCIFITYNANKFIERASFWTYRYIYILFQEDQWSKRYHQLVTSVSSSLLSIAVILSRQTVYTSSNFSQGFSQGFSLLV